MSSMSSSKNTKFSILEYDGKFQEKRKKEIQQLIKSGHYTPTAKKIKYNQPFQFEIDRQNAIK
ncbi:hypothetical protein N9T73_00225 [bacterium]|nr:hypothetical protein [bacterium]